MPGRPLSGVREGDELRSTFSSHAAPPTFDSEGDGTSSASSAKSCNRLALPSRAVRLTLPSSGSNELAVPGVDSPKLPPVGTPRSGGLKTAGCRIRETLRIPSFADQPRDGDGSEKAPGAGMQGASLRQMIVENNGHLPIGPHRPSDAIKGKGRHGRGRKSNRASSKDTSEEDEVRNLQKHIEDDIQASQARMAERMKRIQASQKTTLEVRTIQRLAKVLSERKIPWASHQPGPIEKLMDLINEGCKLVQEAGGLWLHHEVVAVEIRYGTSALVQTHTRMPSGAARVVNSRLTIKLRKNEPKTHADLAYDVLSKVLGGDPDLLLQCFPRTATGNKQGPLFTTIPTSDANYKTHVSERFPGLMEVFKTSKILLHVPEPLTSIVPGLPGCDPLEHTSHDTGGPVEGLYSWWPAAQYPPLGFQKETASDLRMYEHAETLVEILVRQMNVTKPELEHALLGLIRTPPDGLSYFLWAIDPFDHSWGKDIVFVLVDVSTSMKATDDQVMQHHRRLRTADPRRVPRLLRRIAQDSETGATVLFMSLDGGMWRIPELREARPVTLPIMVLDDIFHIYIMIEFAEERGQADSAAAAAVTAAAGSGEEGAQGFHGSAHGVHGGAQGAHSGHGHGHSNESGSKRGSTQAKHKAEPPSLGRHDTKYDTMWHTGEDLAHALPAMLDQIAAPNGFLFTLMSGLKRSSFKDIFTLYEVQEKVQKYVTGPNPGVAGFQDYCVFASSMGPLLEKLTYFAKGPDNYVGKAFSIFSSVQTLVERLSKSMRWAPDLWRPLMCEAHGNLSVHNVVGDIAGRIWLLPGDATGREMPVLGDIARFITTMMFESISVPVSMNQLRKVMQAKWVTETDIARWLRLPIEAAEELCKGALQFDFSSGEDTNRGTDARLLTRRFEQLLDHALKPIKESATRNRLSESLRSQILVTTWEARDWFAQATAMAQAWVGILDPVNQPAATVPKEVGESSRWKRVWDWQCQVIGASAASMGHYLRSMEGVKSAVDFPVDTSPVLLQLPVLMCFAEMLSDPAVAPWQKAWICEATAALGVKVLDKLESLDSSRGPIKTPAKEAPPPVLVPAPAFAVGHRVRLLKDEADNMWGQAGHLERTPTNTDRIPTLTDRLPTVDFGIEDGEAGSTSRRGFLVLASGSTVKWVDLVGRWRGPCFTATMSARGPPCIRATIVFVLSVPWHRHPLILISCSFVLPVAMASDVLHIHALLNVVLEKDGAMGDASSALPPTHPVSG